MNTAGLPAPLLLTDDQLAQCPTDSAERHTFNSRRCLAGYDTSGRYCWKSAVAWPVPVPRVARPRKGWRRRPNEYCPHGLASLMLVVELFARKAVCDLLYP